MSIINRLKSMFREGNKEEKDISNDVPSTSNDVEVKSSELNDTIVSGTKTTVPRNDTKDLASEEGIDPIEETVAEEVSEPIEPSSEEIVEEVVAHVHEKAEAIKEDIHQKAEAIKEDIHEKAEEIRAEEAAALADEETTEEDVVEEVEEDSNKDKERDKMTLLTDKELLTDSNRDPDFTAQFIDAGIETVKHCFQCGTCSGSCPSGRRTPYKVRQIVRKCLLGLKDEVITDDALWMCTTCYTCQERCLRSVKIVEIIKKARNIAAHAGYMAKPHKMTGVFVMNTGHAVPINDNVKALRAKIGLSELPPTTHSYPEALEEVQKLCKITGFDELIGYDEATGGLKE
ncbi:CoB--CoM heterodisulfide reductase subunit C [Methanobrevibacter sp.]|uniref:CoB--CoM heterodisulfide reductase subunit C n=1 Tax=Methanobrevibacter sp. TaxID=66852 RepID=UPI00388FEC34